MVKHLKEMSDPQITQEMKRHAVIVALKADRGDLDILRFLKAARRTNTLWNSGKT